MTQEINLTDAIERGDTFAFQFIWTDDASPPSPLDMRGNEIILSLKISPFIEDEQAAVLVSYTPGEDDVLAQQGNVTITVPGSQSRNLIAGATYHYAVRVVTPDSPEDIEITYLKGTVPVEDA